MKAYCPECYESMIFSHVVVKELENHFQRGEAWVCKECRITKYVEGDCLLVTKTETQEEEK